MSGEPGGTGEEALRTDVQGVWGEWGRNRGEDPETDVQGVWGGTSQNRRVGERGEEDPRKEVQGSVGWVGVMFGVWHAAGLGLDACAGGAHSGDCSHGGTVLLTAGCVLVFKVLNVSSVLALTPFQMTSDVPRSVKLSEE